MQKGRKTIRVGEILNRINAKLSNPNISQDAKAVLCMVLEDILHSTDNYHGYNYVKWLKDGYVEWMAAGQPENNSPFLGPEYDRVYYSGPATGPDEKRFPRQLKC